MKPVIKTLHVWILILLACTILVSDSRAAEDTQFRLVQLKLVPQGNLLTFWQVGNAEFGENLSGTVGTFELKNLSDDEVELAVFYGEYFGPSERLSFTLLFSTERNWTRQTGTIKPGETRKLYSPSYGISPSVQPRELRLYLIRQRFKGQGDVYFKNQVGIRSPALVADTGSSLDWQKLWMASELEGVRGPLIDVALGKVILESTGRLRSAEILNAASPSVGSWFRDFLNRARFTPALSNGKPSAGAALVLIRAILTSEKIDEIFFSPQKNPWVASYLEQEASPQLPPINMVRLEPYDLPYTVRYLPQGLPQHLIQFPQIPTPGFYAFNGVGNYWSGGNWDEMKQLERQAFPPAEVSKK